MLEATVCGLALASTILVVLLAMARWDRIDLEDQREAALKSAQYYEQAWSRLNEQVQCWERKHRKVVKTLGLELKEPE